MNQAGGPAGGYREDRPLPSAHRVEIATTPAPETSVCAREIPATSAPSQRGDVLGIPALDLPRQVFAHLAIAVTTHEKNARRQGLVVPDPLLALRDIALSLATVRQDATVLARLTPATHDEDMDRDARLLMTKRAAAAQLGVSVRTVERLIACGALPCVAVQSSTRIRRSDLEEYVRTLPASGSSSFREHVTTKEGS